MPRDDLTFQLDGDRISPSTLAQAIDGFAKVLEALSDELTPDSEVNWVLTGLSMSSPTISARPESAQPDVIEELRSGYVEAWSSVEGQTSFPHSAEVRLRVDAMTDLINGEVTAMRFRAAGETVEITGPSELVPPKEVPITTFGRLEGRARRIDDPQVATLRFYLADTGYPGSVTCHATEDYAEELRRIWRGRVAVEGNIEWDAEQQRPRHVRNITSIDDVEASQAIAPGTIHGVAVPDGAESAESILRRLRDEW